MNAFQARPVLPRAARLVFLLLALPLLVQATEWPASAELRDLERRSGTELAHPAKFAAWQILWSPVLDAPVIGLGDPVAVGTPASPQALLRLVTSETGTRADFEFVQETTVRGLTRTYYREQRDKLPVLGGRADVVRNARGEISRWNVRAHDGWPAVDTHLLDMATAAQALSATLPAAEWTLEAEHSLAAWFPDDARRTLRPVYWVRVAGQRPHQRWEGIVDATSGEVLMDWSGVHSDNVSGTVTAPYWESYLQSPVQTAPLPFATVFVNDEEEDTTDAAGAFSHQVGDSVHLYTGLSGPYIVVVVVPGDTVRGMTRTEHAPYSPLDWAWAVGTNGATAAELNIYHHVMRVRDWFRGLDSAFVFPAMPVPAVANYPDIPDNAFWTGSALIFGAGSVYNNFGMYSDIIYHEYTHGVTDGIYPSGALPNAGQGGALNEAWSDYFACAITNEPYVAEYIGGTFGSWFRNLLAVHVYPDDWANEVHDDSRFISEALWGIRLQLGAAATNDLAHYACYGLPATFLDYLLAVLETDDDDGNLANGTPHGLVIYNAFGLHGVGPGEDPIFAIRNLHFAPDGTGGSVGDGDRFLEAGETVEMTFDLANDAILYPPPASGVVVTVVPLNASALTVEDGVITLTELAAGDSATLAPVLLHVAENAADQFTKVVIGVTANDGTVTFADTLELMLGQPRLLVVHDDSTSDVEGYIRNRLHAQNRIYDVFQPTETAPLVDSLLPQTGVVLWLSGNARGEVLTTADQALLARYLAAGNRVVLSGQDMFDALDGSDFLEDTLGVAIASDSLRNLVVTALGAPFVTGESLLLTGATGASNQRSMTSLALRGDSRVVACYGTATGTDWAAVEGAHGKALIFGFGIEAISGLGTSLPLAGVLDHIYSWASDVLAEAPHAERPAPLPTVAMLAPAYPNPFNSTTNLRYTLPQVRGAELVVFDVLGRMVDRQRLDAGAGTLSWGAERASGVYFAQLRWNGGRTQPVKLLLVR